MQEKSRNKQTIWIIIVVVIIMIMVVGVTYAYFYALITNNATPISRTSSNISLTYTDCGTNNNSGENNHCQLIEASLRPGDSVEKTFKVQNTGDINTKFTIYFRRLLNTFTNNDLVYKLEDITNSNNITTVVAANTPVPYSATETDNVIMVNDTAIGSGETKEYKLTITFVDRTIDQAYNSAARFLIQVGVNEYTAPIGVDTSGANAPKIVSNLIPVVYDETVSKWKKVSFSQSEWYNYGEQKWANAVTVKENKRGTYNVGDVIEMSDILGMWVWIPRYEYKYTNLGTSYAGGTQTEPGAISIKFVSGTSTTETTDYIIHPAFRDGSSGYTDNAGTFSAWQLGGWDEELTGFWMGKFETSSVTNASGTTSVVIADPIVKPNVIARRYQSVSHQYETIQNVKTYHGINAIDSHMSKNSEWGAVAYLSQSIYGKYGNTDYSGANKEVYINNSESFYTGRSMGMPSGATGNSTSAEGLYTYDEAINGTGASTTGNIYGIYDMAGGSWEYQMGWLNTASSNFGYRNNSGTDTNDAGFSSAPDHKYYEAYTTTTAATACGGSVCYGQALSETAGWYGDYTNMVSTTYPWFMRGSSFSNSSHVVGGPFGFLGYVTGNSSYDIGVRAVLV